MTSTTINLKDAGFPALEQKAYAAPRKKAYIGVNGERYRILVPVRHIWIERAEGLIELCTEHAFKSWHDASWYLMQGAKTAPEGGAYDKHDFEVTFADGFHYSGRFDLQREMIWPKLEDHIHEFLTFVADNPRGSSLYGEEDRKDARTVAETYDLGQRAIPAGDDWEVIWDYRTEKRPHGELQNEVWPEGHIAD
jgi:hypothetical protein